MQVYAGVGARSSFEHVLGRAIRASSAVRKF